MSHIGIYRYAEQLKRLKNENCKALYKQLCLTKRQSQMHHSKLICCFQIVCRFKSFPPAIDFRWTFTNQEDSAVKTEENSKELRQMSPNSIRHLKRPRKGMMEMNTNMSLSAPASAISTASLKYRADSRKDFGTVECFASNLVGESRKPCLFTIVPAGMQIVHDTDGAPSILFY